MMSRRVFIILFFCLTLVLFFFVDKNQSISEQTAVSNKTIEKKLASEKNIVILPPNSQNEFFEYVDNYDFSKIDNHVKSTPSSAESSISGLASYLTRPARNDLEKIRAIFVWVAENINYDTDSFFSGRPTTYGASEMLRSRKSVCEGYANMVQALCEGSGLECVKISGYSKGYGFRPGQTFAGKPTDHAWNAVKIDGKWYLLDSTWGAGYVDGRNYIQKFSKHYFLTPPEKFIYDHLPEDSKWQLLDSPISESEYSNLVYVRPPFFSNGLDLVSHTKAVINTGSDLQVELRGPETALLISNLIYGNTQLPNEYTFTQIKNGKITIDIMFPSRGEYLLRLYAKSIYDDPNMSYSWALDYAINASEGKSGQIGFPTTYSTFTEKGYLHYPKNGYLKVGTTVDFKIEIEGADKVAIVTNQWNHLKKSGNVFTGKVKIPNVNQINVYANFGQGNSYSGLMVYRTN